MREGWYEAGHSTCLGLAYSLCMELREGPCGVQVEQMRSTFIHSCQEQGSSKWTALAVVGWGKMTALPLSR